MSERTSSSPEAASWSRYWAGGALHSCPNAFAGNYDDEVREHWHACFSKLPDGARVLDIGTGNGAIALLAQDAAKSLGRRFQIEGIDAAIIDPAAAVTQHGVDFADIAFHGETRIEDTGYPPQHFDAVSSHYAIEYSDVAQSLRELARILKPGGWAEFVIHHAGSVALETSRAELRAFTYLRDEAPVLLESCRLLQKLLHADNAAAFAALMQETELREHDQKVRWLLQKASSFAQSQPGAAFVHGIVQRIAKTLQETPTTGPASALERLAILGEEMSAHHNRLSAISRAAHTQQNIAEFCDLAAMAGFTVAAPRELVRRERDLVGWVCSASLPSSLTRS